MLTIAERVEAFNAAFPIRTAAGARLTAYAAKEGDRIHGMWMGGQDFRNKSKMYGSYPPSFLRCVFALFPDAQRILHLFSGSLTAEQVELDYLTSQGKGKLTDDEWGQRRRTWNCPTQIRFDNGLHPEAKTAKPDVIGDAENIRAQLVVGPPTDRGGPAMCCQLGTQGWCQEHHAHSGPHMLSAAFDLIVADPPYALEDQKRYWNESMESLGECSRCNLPVVDHSRWPSGEFYCNDYVGYHGDPSGRHRGEGYHPEPPVHSSYTHFKPLRKQVVLDECAKIVRPGGHVVWLDCIWPQHSKTTWRTVGIIGLVRSTSHRIRQITIFERQ